MGSSSLILALIAAASPGNSIPKEELEKQQSVFQELWYEDFLWKFADLPAIGSVSKDRVPYSGYIYLDKNGGTANVLRKYDRALHNNYLSATSWEYGDTSEALGQTYTRTIRGRGRFGGYRTITYGGVNHWYGHCNGWSSAAIRHAEPQQSVTVNGVEFTPADIKGLLAEIYMYNQHEVLAGYESYLNPGTFHAILANWLGRGSHPVVMDSDPGPQKWNYPIFSFASASVKRSSREVEVRANVFYAKDSDDREHDKSPRLRKQKSFHYMLELNRRGDIVGGYYFTDSDRIDFLWIPLSPQLSGEEGNERGNPHMDVARVLSIWRKSVPRDVRRKWLIVDPSAKDRAVEVSDPSKLLPRNIRIVPPATPFESESLTVVEDAGDADAADGS